MIYKTYQSLDNIEFIDSIEDVSNKLGENIQLGKKVFMGKKNPTILWKNVLIVFDENGKHIKYFEIEKSDLFYKGINIFKTEYSILKDKFLNLDSNLNFKEGGFDSYECGLGIYRGTKNGNYTKYPKSVIAFNKNYKNAEEPSPDDIINYYLNNKD